MVMPLFYPIRLAVPVSIASTMHAGAEALDYPTAWFHGLKPVAFTVAALRTAHGTEGLKLACFLRRSRHD
jgi:hypothetical protein